MIVSLMAAAALMGAGDPDGVIVTAPNGAGAPPVAAEQPVVQTPPRQSAAHGLTTDQQIEQWIAARREADDSLPFAGAPVDDRRVHGEISVGVGTGGYRSYGGSISLPVGQAGRLDMHYMQSDNDPRSRYNRYDPYWSEASGAEPWGYRPSAEEASTPSWPDRTQRR